MKIVLSLMAIGLLFINSIAFSESMEEVINKGKIFGMDVSSSSNNITITADEETLAKRFSEIESVHGFKSPTAYQDFTKSPIITTYKMAVVYAKHLIPYIYSAPSVDYVTFSVNILTINKYGFIDNNTCLTFDFSRELYNKINWARDNDTLLMDISDDIHVKGSKWCEEQAINENSDNDSSMNIKTTTYIQGNTTFDGDSINTNATITSTSN